MSYGVFKLLQPPTGTEHCIQAQVLGEDLNLVLGKANCLQIFRIVQPKASNESQTTRPSLELLFEKRLFGNIESLNTLRFPGSSRDALLLSFRDAKASVIEFEPSINDFRVVSLHYFEEERFKEGRNEFRSVPQLRVDIKQRCAAMLIYDTKMVIIPFKTQNLFDEEDMEVESDGNNTSSFVFDLLAMGIKNVRDYVFLQGYYEPTLLIMFEPITTWTGRLAFQRDTVCLAAISLSLSQQKHPIVWTVEMLPYDCYRLVSVPEPLGGALVFATNHLVYCNQNNRYGLLLNSVLDPDHRDLKFHMDKSDVELTLDAAHYVFLAPERLLVSLKGGELYLFHLQADARTIQNVTITKAGASVLTSCMCRLSNNLVFLGSRVGDSLLIQYTENTLETENEDDEVIGRPEKRMKLDIDLNVTEDDSYSFNQGSRFTELTDEEAELRMYTQSSKSERESKLTSYTFGVCDSIPNLGPIADSVMGVSRDPASSSHTEYGGKQNVEIIGCAGVGKNGSICVLQGGVRPELVTAFKLPGCTGAWSLHHRGKHLETNGFGDDKSKENWHSYLVLTRDNKTMILETGEEFNEISNKVDFYVSGPTFDAGNVLDKTRIVQVHNHGVRLLHGVSKVQDLSLPDQIIQSSIEDPYCLLLLKDKSLLLLRVSPETKQFVQTVPKLQDPETYGGVTACSLFMDESSTFAPLLPLQDVDIEDEDKDLYGESAETSDSSGSKRIFSILTRESGRLEIYLLPDFLLVYATPNFSLAPSIAVHNPQKIVKGKKDTGPSFFASTPHEKVSPDPIVEEVCLMYPDTHSKLPYIFAILTTGDLLIYKCFKLNQKEAAKSPKMPKMGSKAALNAKASVAPQPIKFQKLEHSLMCRNSRNQTPNWDSFRSPKVKKFMDISGKRGAFICGSRPAWFLCQRGYPRVHQIILDGQIDVFTPFHNVNCNQGFIYFTKEGSLKICQLPTQISYENSILSRKVHLRVTPHTICYHQDTNTYALCVSYRVPRRMEGKEEDPGFNPVVHPFDDKFELRIVASANNWEVVDKYELDHHEHALVVRTCNLKCNQDQRDALKSYIIVGTGYNNGEDSPCKGRVIIFEIIPIENQYRDPNATEEPKPKLKLIQAKEQKGPVTVVTSIGGYLLVAIGPKIIIFNFSDSTELIGMAFYDAQIYINSVNIVKNYILCGDIYKSIFFLRWKESNRSLTLLAKDFYPLSVFSADFLIYQQTLSFAVSDLNKNLQIFTYAPLSLESRGGQMLVCKGDFHVGSNIEKFVRVRMNTSGKDSYKNGLIFGTLDGSVGYVAPIDELVFKRLFALQTKMTYSLPHFAGLNPKSFRQLKNERKLIRNAYVNILDGELLFRYQHLEFGDQKKLARQIGTTVEQIMDNLQEIDWSMSLF